MHALSNCGSCHFRVGQCGHYLIARRYDRFQFSGLVPSIDLVALGFGKARVVPTALMMITFS